MTELGERYLPRCIDIVETTQALKTEAVTGTQRPSGRLRVTIAGFHARTVVSTIIPQFLAEYPEVSLELDTSNEFVDLIAEKIDLAIRVGKLEDSSLVARKICEARTVLVAAPHFLNRVGRPKDSSVLAEYPCLIDSVPSYGARWPFLRGKSVNGPAIINDGEMIRYLAVSGLGIAYLPELIVKDDITAGNLEVLLPEVASKTGGIFAVFPSRGYISPAARAFADAIQKAFN